MADIDTKEAYTDTTDTSPSPTRSNEVREQTRVQRVFNALQFFTLSITFMSSWEAIAGNLYTVFYNGGPSTLVWGFLLAWAGACAQSASLAEMAAIQPIAGAQYHWTWALAPKNVRRFTTWMQGWITWAGWISMTVGVGNSTAYWIQSLVTLNYPDFAFSNYNSTLLIWALLVPATLVNITKFKLVPWIESIAGFFHIALWLVYSIVLLALAPKNSASFVFKSRVDSASTSGWTNDFIGWNLGLQTSVWAFVGFDAAVHLGEEVRRAPKTVPRIMFFTNVLNGLLAWLFALVILFCMGDPAAALEYQQPMLAVLLNATGNVKAATAMGVGFVFISIMAMVVNVASVGRLTWSWARDGGLPKWLAFVDAKERVPVRAVLVSVTIPALLSLVNIGSSLALQVLISLSTLAVEISYFIAILCILSARYNKTEPFQPGCWSIGKLGVPVNIFALLYTAYVVIWLPFPASMPITGANMNYSIVIFGGVVLLAVGWWVVKRKSWPGLSEAIIEAVVKDVDVRSVEDEMI